MVINTDGNRKCVFSVIVSILTETYLKKPLAN